LQVGALVNKTSLLKSWQLKLNDDSTLEVNILQFFNASALKAFKLQCGGNGWHEYIVVMACMQAHPILMFKHSGHMGIMTMFLGT